MSNPRRFKNNDLENNRTSFRTQGTTVAKTGNQQKRQRDLHQALEDFDEFQNGILPKIRDALKAGKSSKEITEMARSMAAARIATIAATEPDAGKALAASRDILDRTEGKAVERKEIHHRLGQLKEDEIDALLISGLNDIGKHDSDNS
jgi:cysteinyl-tRNA synthetase